MRWAGHVALTGDRRVTFMAVVEKPEGKKPRRNWGIILKWIFKKWDGEAWSGWI
jgi:hypothetical protein